MYLAVVLNGSSSKLNGQLFGMLYGLSRCLLYEYIKMLLSSFKRKRIEKWLASVSHHLHYGDLCRTVTNQCSDGRDESDTLWVPRTSSVLLHGDKTKKDGTKRDYFVADSFKDSKALPLVDFNHSHTQTDIRGRIFSGLPALSSIFRHRENLLLGQDRGQHMPVIVVQGEENVCRRDVKTELEALERSKLVSAPVLTYRRSNNTSVDLDLSGHILTNATYCVERSKTAPFKNKVNKARKLLAKRTPDIHTSSGQNRLPIQNCWTMAELTW